jgi:diguanylate cyclase (GGDEF)-like protein
MPPSPTPHPVVDFFRRFGLALMVFAVAAALTLENYHSTVEEQLAATRTQFQLTAQQQIARLQERVIHLLGHGDALQRQIALQPGISAPAFTHLAAPVLHLHPEVLRAGLMRLDGNTPVVDISTGPGNEGGSGPTPGSLFPATRMPDAGQLAHIHDGIARAARTGQPTASQPYLLSPGTSDKAQAVLVTLPVVPPERPEEPHRKLVFIEIPVDLLIEQSLQPAISRDAKLHFELELVDGTDEPRFLYTSPDFRIGEMSYADAINVADRRWLMITAPSGLSYSLLPGQDAGGRLFAGLSMGILAAVVLYVLQTRADAIRHQVREKTLALADANDALGQYVKALGETNRLLETEVDKHAKAETLLRETTSLQRAILDCAEYAIVYTDSAGIIRVLNPAAERLFGHRPEISSATRPRWSSTPPKTSPAGPSPTRPTALPPWLTKPAAATWNPGRSPCAAGTAAPSRPTSPSRWCGTASARSAAILASSLTSPSARPPSSRIRHLAHYDNLTSLPNRTLLNQHLAEAMNAARERHRGVAVLFTDLDRFKYVNDTLGHQAGDQLLLSVAQRLRACVRDGDMVARTGGDEFVVVLDDLQEGSMPEDVAERILASLARPFELCSQQVTVTPSIGIALYPNDGNDGEALIKNADAAMYLAKERGRNNFQFFDHGLSARYSERLELENRLRHALDENQLDALLPAPGGHPVGRADRHGSPDPLAPARRQHDPAGQIHPHRRRMRPHRAHRRLGAAGGLPAESRPGCGKASAGCRWGSTCRPASSTTRACSTPSSRPDREPACPPPTSTWNSPRAW